MAYASGKYALAICDTCSWSYPYKVMRMTWKGNKVCPECYEPKNPQVDPPVITADAETLWQPRPEVSLPQAQLGKVTTTNPSEAVVDSTGTNMMTFTDDPIGSAFSGEIGTGEVGNLTVSTN
tara:strand:+ start:201 stop:566 length:366 start_codon:yes stop_codon:yes gene_type:complete